MRERKPIQLTDPIRDIILNLAEGNPGAVNVLVELLKDETRGFFDLLNLDDMNIRGPQIWVGYKDFCDEDIEKFRTALRERDPKMVEAINNEMAYDPACPKAVTGGWSFQPTAR